MALDKGQNILITQGEHAVSDDPDTIISTLLGSCVSVCLWDDVSKVGGMNHLILAGKVVGSGGGYDVAGVAEMELLINAILKIGGRRERLKAKVFGGADLLGSGTGIGKANADFAFDFLNQENIPCENSSVAGRSARNIKFWPSTGRVSMRLASESVAEPAPTAKAPTGNDMELF